MRQYLEQPRVKDGFYKDFPQIKNGMKDITYKGELKPVPTFIMLMEGSPSQNKAGKSKRCQPIDRNGSHGPDHLLE